MHEALLYLKNGDGSVSCRLCRHYCRVAEGARGKCLVRQNSGGTLFTDVYGTVVTEHVDPIEKKPLYHFIPGTLTYSIATVGCNFTCLNCQNHDIAHFDITRAGYVPGRICTPEEIVSRAVAAGCRSISFTYTEPTIYFEFALDVARLARKAGLKNIFVTNGYISSEALDLITPFLDAVNVDLKGFSADFYRRVTGGSLSGVLECLCDYYARGVWIEVTTLLIPGENDHHDVLTALAEFIANRLDCYVPWHISRFFPLYRMSGKQATSLETLVYAAAIGKKAGLSNVYVGNYPGVSENTVCPECSAVCIRRSGYQVDVAGCDDGWCRVCNRILPGVWK